MLHISFFTPFLMKTCCRTSCRSMYSYHVVMRRCKIRSDPLGCEEKKAKNACRLQHTEQVAVCLVHSGQHSNNNERQVLSAPLVLVSVAGVVLLFATAPTCCMITRSRTASEREVVCCCVVIDLRLRKKQLATAVQRRTYAHVDLPQAHVAARCCCCWTARL